ncbi:MAG: nuclear transport factor 2 family protein [Pyrinomonadaceae bacterium]
MRRSMIVMALIVGPLLPALGQQASRSKSVAKDEQAVRAVIAALAEAGLRRDVAAIDRLYADDYFHTNADGSIMTKEQVLASYRAPAQATFESNEHTEERVQLHGTAAVVSGTVTLKGRMNNQPFVRTWRVTYVLSRRGGRWRIVASHASIIA